MKSVFAQLSPDCREATRAQSQAIDHHLPPAKRLGVWLHLSVCKWCRRYGKQIRFLRAASITNHEEFKESPPQKLSSEARERIKRRLLEKH